MVKSSKFIFLLLILLVILISVASADARTFRKAVSKNVVDDKSQSNSNYVSPNSADTNNAGQNLNSNLNLEANTAYTYPKSSSHMVATPYGNYAPPANVKVSENLRDQLKEKDLKYVYPLLMFKSSPTPQQWDYLKSLGIIPTANSYNSYTYEIQLPLKKEAFLALDNSDFVYWAGYLPSGPFVPPFEPEEVTPVVAIPVQATPADIEAIKQAEIRGPHVIVARGGTYAPKAGIDPNLAVKREQTGTTYAYLLGKYSLSLNERRLLENAGVRIVAQYRGPSTKPFRSAPTYVISLPLNKLNSVANQPFTYWIGYVPPKLKITPEVLNPKNDYDSLNLYLFGNDMMGEFRERLQQKGVTVLGYEESIYGGVVRSSVPLENIDEVANLDFVSFIDIEYSGLATAGESDSNLANNHLNTDQPNLASSSFKEVAGVTPGESLYVFDRTAENIQLFLTFNNIKKSKFLLQLAEERIAEVQILVQNNQIGEISNLVRDYSSHVVESKRLGENNVEITNLVEQSTSKNTIILQEISEQVPGEQKQEIQTAIETSKITTKTSLVDDSSESNATKSPLTPSNYTETKSVQPTTTQVEALRQEEISNIHAVKTRGGTYAPRLGVDPNLSAQIGKRNTTYAYLLGKYTLNKSEEQIIQNLAVQWITTYNGPSTKPLHSAPTYVVKISLNTVNTLANQPFTYWIGYVPPKLKIAPEVLSYTEDYRWLNIHLFGNDTTGEFRQQLQQSGATIFDYNTATYGDYWYGANVSSQDLDEVANLDFVSFIDIEYGGLATAGLDESASLVSADYLRPTYNGAGGAVCIIDSGYASHMDLPALTSGQDYTGEGIISDVCRHGTFVSGVLFGRGLENSKYKGVATGVGNVHFAKVVSTAACSGTGTALLNGISWCGSSPANIATTSIKMDSLSGCDGLDSYSKRVDEMVYTNLKTYVILASNLGPNANTVSSPGCSKNAITVGATLDYPSVDDIAGFSSRGPTGDGRIKPDVVAPGDLITSTDTGGGYRSDSGTSYSTPHVTGLVATLFQHYSWLVGYPERTKARIMSTAIARGSYLAYGQGKVDSYTAHWNADFTNGWDSTTIIEPVGNPLDTTNEWHYTDLVVPNDAQKLVLVLTWIEPPAAGGATEAVIHDLDLWLDKGADQAGGNEGEWSSTYSWDNVERIVITPADGLTGGTYRVKTYAYNIAGGQLPPRYAVGYFVIKGNPNPTLSLTLNAPASANVGQPFTVTADVSPASYIASGVYSKITVPADVSIQSMSTTREDGTTMNYGADNDIVLGDIYVADTRSASWTLASNTPGTKTISVNAYGSNTNSPTQNVNVNIVSSNNAPTANFVFSPANPTINDIVQFTDQSTDSDGTIAGWSWDFGDSSTSTLQNPTHQYATAGTYTVSLIVTDNGGAQGSKNQAITVGNAGSDAPPAVSVSAPANVEVGNPIRIISTVTDDLAVSWIKIFVDSVEQIGLTCTGIGTTSANCYKDLTYSTLGNHAYYSAAVDSGSNFARDPLTGTKSFRVVDGTAPTISVAASPNPVQIGQTITITANANDNYQLSEIIIDVDGVNGKSCTGGVTTCTYQTSYGSSGAHTYLAWAIDSSSNAASDPPSGTKSFTVSADATNPTVIASALPNPANIGQTITVTGKATDNVLVSTVEVFVDGILVKTCTLNSQSGSCDHFTSYSTPGIHTYYSKATDSSVNSAQTAVQNFDIIGDTPPTVTVSAPSTVNKGQTITIASTANDNNQVSDIKVYLDGNLAKTCTINSQSGNCDYPVIFTTCGDHFYYATTSDNSGNTARDPASGEKKFSVIGCGGSDNIPPKISLTLSGDDPSERKQVTFTATASDNVAVSKITIYPGRGTKTCTINAPSGTCTYSTVWPLVRDYYAVAIDSSGNTAKSN